MVLTCFYPRCDRTSVLKLVVALTMLLQPVDAGKPQPVSVTMRGIWFCVFVIGFVMAFSGETWTINSGVGFMPALCVGMFVTNLQAGGKLPPSGFIPLGIGLFVWIIAYFWACKNHDSIMSICCGLLFAIFALLGVSIAGLTPYSTMTLYGGLGGFLLGAALGWCYAHNPRFGFLKVAAISGFLMAISAHAVITGCDLMVFFLNSVSAARADPGYMGDARKASILLFGEWLLCIVLTYCGESVIGPIVNKCTGGNGTPAATKVATEEAAADVADAGKAAADTATNETPLTA